MDGGLNQHAIIPVPRRVHDFRDCYELDISISGSSVADEHCRPSMEVTEDDEGTGMGHGEL